MHITEQEELGKKYIPYTTQAKYMYLTILDTVPHVYSYDFFTAWKRSKNITINLPVP